MEQDVTLTLHPEKRKGFFIPTNVYKEVREFIMAFLVENGEVIFKDLIDLAQRSRFSALRSDIAWHLLVVKLDLEARGIICCSISVGLERNQVVRIKRKNFQKKRNIYG